MTRPIAAPRLPNNPTRRPSPWLCLGLAAAFTLAGCGGAPSKPAPTAQAVDKVIVKKSDFDAWLERYRVEPDEDRVKEMVEEIVSKVSKQK